jgi:uncharacterized membrane protein YfcA
MADIANIVVLWIAFLVLAVPYVLWAKHPAVKPVAAYLIFVTIFSAAAWIIYSFTTLMVANWWGTDALAGREVPILIFIASVFLGGLLGQWQISKPPRPAPPI